MNTKTCCSCRRTIPVECFGKNKTKRDGYQTMCRDCFRLYGKNNRGMLRLYYREYSLKNKTRIVAVSKNWRLRNGDRVSSMHIRYRNKFPDKHSARIELNNAIKLGLVNKPRSCGLCGRAPKYLHGHHEDYSKPLDVLWVCPLCHSLIHQEKRNDGRTNQSAICTESPAASHDRTEARNGHASL